MKDGWQNKVGTCSHCFGTRHCECSTCRDNRSKAPWAMARCKTCGGSGMRQHELLKKDADREGRNLQWSWRLPSIDPQWVDYKRKKEAEGW